MRFCSIKSYIYVHVLINQINAKNYYYKKEETENKENDKKDNNNQIIDFGGIKGLIGILENNKVSFNINTDSGSGSRLKKIAETVDDYNGEFNYGNVKNLKIQLLGLKFSPKTIETYIDIFRNNLEVSEKISFLKGKLAKLIYKTDNRGLVIYVFNNSRYYFRFPVTLKNGEESFGIVNYNNQTRKCLEYGVLDNGTYFKLVPGASKLFCEPENKDEYRKYFLEGK